MDSLQAMEFAKAAMMLILTIAGPMLLASLIVGMAVSLFQALTQLQEGTITFVPKMLTLGVVFLVTLPLMGQALATFMAHIADAIISGK